MFIAGHETKDIRPLANAFCFDFVEQSAVIIQELAQSSKMLKSVCGKQEVKEQ